MLLALCAWLPAFSSGYGLEAYKVMVIDSIFEERFDLDHYLYYFEDFSSELDFDDISAPGFQEKFSLYTGGGSIASWRNAHWGRIAFRSELGHPMRWKLYIGSFDHVEVFFRDESGEVHRDLRGYYTESPQRDMPSLMAFDLELPPLSERVLYIRVQNKFQYKRLFRLALFSGPRWSEIANRERINLLQGIFHGVLWIMVLYNFFLYLFNRHRAYLYYCLYVFFVSIYFLNVFAYLFEAILWKLPILMIYVWFTVNLSVIFYIQFVRDFINLKKLLPAWDRAAGWIIRGLAGLILFEMAFLWLARSFVVLDYIIQVLLFAGAVVSILLIIKLFRVGDRVARYYITGTAALVTAVVLSGIVFLKHGSISHQYLFYLQLGIIAEIMIFSLGLAYKMNLVEREKRIAQERLIGELEEKEAYQQKLNRQLEAKVEERTGHIRQQNRALEQQKEEIEAQKEDIDLKNSELARQNEALRSLNEEKNHLIGILAHDLRNPLASAISMAQFLKSDSALDEDQSHCVGIIDRSLERINTMISKILDIRAIEDKGLNMALEPVDLEPLIQAVISSLNAKATSKQIQIQSRILQAFASVDRNYFVQIMDNLVSNAIKFSPPGTQVAISMSKSDGLLRICVADQGPGIRPEEMGRLFGKYQRLSAKPTGGESSTGLGLSIAKKYTEAMKGAIWCESKPGEGASFYLQFALSNRQATSG